MPGFVPNRSRKVLTIQLRDLLGALPDAVAALILVAAIELAESQS